jgi:hypothetical protein
MRVHSKVPLGPRGTHAAYRRVQANVSHLPRKHIPRVELCHAASLDIAVGPSSDNYREPAASAPRATLGVSSSQIDAPAEKPLVRVQLSVLYRVHSRQMLCIGGSQIPFGWSFLSIAKVPMTWTQGDVWTCEVLCL